MKAITKKLTKLQKAKRKSKKLKVAKQLHQNKEAPAVSRKAYPSGMSTAAWQAVVKTPYTLELSNLCRRRLQRGRLVEAR